ncbi:MAG: DUF2791 family P-loop domain-containing protein [Deltaproteobacteria bacterium]|nr:DUF2791 family P-loop domain-containing protein [Deltaproteobacteria bacterium]
MNELTQKTAMHIIERVGGPGVPPEYGFQFFTAGVDPYLSIIEKDYLSSFIKQGGSSFKMVVGIYGGGKTHFLYCIRDLAWNYNFVVSYVRLSPNESPFHRLELVYNAIMRGITPPLTPQELLSGYDRGITSFIRSWYSEKFQEISRGGFQGASLNDEVRNEILRIDGIENISFSKAIKRAFESLLNKEEEDFNTICQWLSGEGLDPRIRKQFGILQKIDKTTAFSMIRSLIQCVRQIGYSGLVLLLDEAEQHSSLSTKQRAQQLNNLREIIDETGQTNIQGIMIFYAVPDENFLEGKAQIYEALKQRLQTVFNENLNPSGVKIELEKMVQDRLNFLIEVGERLSQVYEIAYSHKFKKSPLEKTIRTIADAAIEKRFFEIGYKRLFVQMIIRGFHFLSQKGKPPEKQDITGIAKKVTAGVT